ncbi:MAG: hypothetical protein BGN86_17145 [Caulobacterales bacterium 68-7]|nr:MAG: hypothetical protein BGN86_17145 [Caulobacterales bacterium 68-7]
MSLSGQNDQVMHVQRGGCDIEARWRVAGDEVHVECSFGADHAPLGGAPPARVAELLVSRLAAAVMGRRLEPLMC